jgi:hypothetical protein
VQGSPYVAAYITRTYAESIYYAEKFERLSCHRSINKQLKNREVETTMLSRASSMNLF